MAAGEGFLRCEDTTSGGTHYTTCFWGVDIEYNPASERGAGNPTTYYWFRDGVYITDYTTGGSYHGQFDEGGADSCEGSPSGTFRYSLSTASGSDDEFLSGVLDCGTGVWTSDAGTNSFYAESLSTGSGTTTASATSAEAYAIEAQTFVIGWLGLAGVAALSIGAGWTLWNGRKR